ncbi:MAG: PEP-CTERM sorting domain-containing protein, partial [Armatimonadetes bacterium]|nr:PEP-CTERM sorting domain-containing protein [Armatimonadota bacterium]
QTTTPGGHSDYRVRLETGADSVWQWAYHSQYSPGLANATLDFLSWPSSNNFDAVMAPNSTWEGDVVRWNAASNTPNGTLQAGIGFMGGKYVGDLNFISDQRFTWTVVPEPTGLLALGLATALLLRKRRG